MDSAAVYNVAVTPVAPTPPPSLAEMDPKPRFVEDDAGYLYDAASREVLTRVGKLDGGKLLRTEAIRAMVMAIKRLDQLIEDELVDTGVTHGQYKALMCVKNYGVTGTQMHAIAGFLGVTPRNVTGLVDGLEAAGLVERVPDPADRRATIVRVTAEGDAAAMRSRRVHQAVVNKVMGILTEEEKLQLRHLSTKLLHAVEEASAGDGRKKVG
jgi:DNA-binding MarR family transcriptional regulator